MGEKKENNGDEKNNNNGGEGTHIRLFINKKELFEGRLEGSFEGCFEGVEYMKVACVHNKLRVEVDLGKPREKKKVDGKPQKKADEENPKGKEKKGNNGDKKNNNNGGEGIHIRLLINNKEHFKGRFEGSFEGSFEGVEYMKVDCVHNKLRMEVDLGKPREKKKVDGKPQKKEDEENPQGKEHPVVIKLDPKKKEKKSVRFDLPKKQDGGHKKEKGGAGEKKEKGSGEGGKGKKDGGGVLPKK